MDINDDEVRRELRAIDADQRAVDRTWRSTLARIFDPSGGVSDDERHHILGVPNRRQFLRIGGVTIAGAPLIERLARAGEAAVDLLPSGKARLSLGPTLTIDGARGKKTLRLGFVRGLLPAPTPVWLDEDGRYFGWIVEEDGHPIAGIGMLELDWPPHPNHPLESRRGCILNVYVEPSYRRRGIARRMMERAREEAEARGLTYLVLHATAEGRILYEALGWTDTAEMALSIAPAVA